MRIPVKFRDIAFSGQTETGRKDRKPSKDQGVSPLFPLLFIMRSGVKQRSFHCAEVFLSLVFNVDQRPLSAAKGEVLQTGKLEEIVFLPHHDILWQVTPSGRED